MEITKLEISDIKNALDLIWKVFLEFEALDYSPQGIEEFKKFITYDSMIKLVEKEEIIFWGCRVNLELTGVIATKGGNHICLFFVDKEYHRQGTGKRLFHKVLEECVRKNSRNSITVNSSPYAIEVYHRLGFVNLDQEQIVNGLRFTPMRYTLQ
ncbi:GNAT family N-acetyltransferase [Neobacillus sp. DY30]|uniref:GNAT family N-acetyltransferase n=1 Tax=Neobacillus sp. DY30 TaxID=3047871 RepID=UPI0024C0A4EC|nr:GNAT family N-acetyltransferase [Neobacillus sp. DY30]WHY03126.1 GNAT family N-acetyltransferase [Neobacillus sp. DY30]